METAELRVKNRQDITIHFWRETVDKIIDINDKEILSNKGKISNKQMEEIVGKIYEDFDVRRKREEAEREDLEELEELKKLENHIQSTRIYA